MNATIQSKSATCKALAERCEQATGPDRKIDAEIFCAKYPSSEAVIGHLGQRIIRYGGYDFSASRLAEYTASIVAAMSLVPSNFWLERLGECQGGRFRAELIERTSEPLYGVCDGAATPALALTAAALRAMAAS